MAFGKKNRKFRSDQSADDAIRDSERKHLNAQAPESRRESEHIDAGGSIESVRKARTANRRNKVKIPKGK